MSARWPTQAGAHLTRAPPGPDRLPEDASASLGVTADWRTDRTLLT